MCAGSVGCRSIWHWGWLSKQPTQIFNHILTFSLHVAWGQFILTMEHDINMFIITVEQKKLNI